jgi:apolipoprotein N-acyltransferase
VAVEYLNAVALGNWGSTAVTQLDSLPLAQVLSLTGLWGVTFLVAWFGPVVLWTRENGFEWKKIRGGMSLFSGALLLVLIYGGLRLALTQQPGLTVRIASLHLDDDSMDALTSRLPGLDAPPGVGGDGLARKRRALDSYFEKSVRCARQGASVVFWPEAAVRVGRDEEIGFLARASRFAFEESVYFMPSYFLEPAADGAPKGENKCAMFEPSGKEAWKYVKAHPVPGSPDAPGEGIVPVIDTPFGRMAVAICYDMDFPRLIRQAGRKKADIMLVPAWDWKAIDPLHSRMAVCRAVENGFSMVRHSVEGLSLAVDALGRPLGAVDHFRTADRVMLVDVSASGIRTGYSLAGDILAWLSIAGLVASAVLALTQRGRRATGVAGSGAVS